MLRILGFVCFIFFSQQINAQCCSAGNPSSSGTGSMAKNYLSINSSFVHSYSDTYFKGNSEYDFDYLENTKFDFGLINVSYGLSNKFTISTELGYFINKSMAFAFIDATRKAYGLGDAAVDLKYQIVNLKKQLLSISTSVKTSIPIGEFDQMDKNVVLPIDIQPSSGSFKLKPSLSISKRFFGSKLSLNSFISTEFSQKINTERSKYKYGNLYSFVLSTSHATTKKLNIGLGFNFTLREQAIIRPTTIDTNFVRQWGSWELVNATGGTFINIQPRFSYQLPEGFGLSTSLNIPIYRNVNGIQLTNKYILVIGVSKGFDLSSNTIKPLFSDILLQSFNENSFFVDGICGMCKTRIEDLAYSVKGVKWAEWNLESKQLVVKFDGEINTEKLAKTLTKGGHDNWMFTAKNKAYNNLHSCCKYRVDH